MACAAGFWKSWTGSQACARCHEHTTSAPSSTAPTDCYCLAGFQPFAIAQNSSSGTLALYPLSTPAASVAEVPNPKCESCPAGQYKQLSGDVACVLCPPGTYQDHRGATSCRECLADKFMPSSGSTACISCPAPEQWSPPASTSVLACQCGKGSYGPPGACYCLSCPLGHFKASERGDEQCFACAPGTFANSTVLYLSSIYLSICCLLCHTPRSSIYLSVAYFVHGLLSIFYQSLSSIYLSTHILLTSSITHPLLDNTGANTVRGLPP